MMNTRLILNLILVIGSFLIISCGECEDKTLEVSDALLEYLPYQDTTSIVMRNNTDETMTFTINPDVDTSTEDNRDCTTTTVKPFITLDTEVQQDFMRIWVSFNEDFLGDNEQLWFIMDEEDGSILSSGQLQNPLLEVNDVVLNGVTFENVIPFVVDRDPGLREAIYVQRNVGLIGFEQSNQTWIIQ